MGADLLVAWTVIDTDKAPDFDAGRKAVKALSSDQIEQAAAMVGLDEREGDRIFADADRIGQAMSGESTSIRRYTNNVLGRIVQPWALALVDELERAWTTEPRDVVKIEVRGATVMLTGGMSWGDDPTDSWNSFADLYAMPEVVRAMGFDVL
jgi:hypothetical protein